ncbi:MAG TPA: DUF4399 domain-containing protein [Longimicrobiales bacterium]|nr:DUF4399 domain-containing protein [Longimicrobiales bacterium]
MRTLSIGRVTLLASLAILPACGGDTPEPEAQSQQAQETAAITVTILDPAEGAEVQGPTVTVSLAAAGIRIVPAGAVEAGTGHHHLYLDTDLGEPGVTVPKVEGAIIHLGTGDSDYTFENVSPGPHRLIAVVADGVHVPLAPWVVDTVNFVVR